jgi:LuxR family maltose regulon positive regulatory protein
VDALEAALALAEPEGYVRTFLDEGAQLDVLLKLLEKRSSSATYVQRLRAALGTAPTKPPPVAGMIDGLSGRELDVLRLLATDLTGPEIARHLVVSLNTVRTHTKNAYLKLGVNTRMAAVRRARELDLL